MDFSGKQFPKEVIIMAVRWYLAYPLSYRNVEELICEWNITLDHSSVQRWLDEFGSYLMSKVRKYMKRNFKRSWWLDETYIKVKGVLSQSSSLCQSTDKSAVFYCWRLLCYLFSRFMQLTC